MEKVLQGTVTAGGVEILEIEKDEVMAEVGVLETEIVVTEVVVRDSMEDMAGKELDIDLVRINLNIPMTFYIIQHTSRILHLIFQ